MDLKLKEKKVLVTGSSRGIGKSIAEAFQQEGSLVLTNSRTKVLELENHICADVTSAEGLNDLKNAIQTRFAGQLDILVCNVGTGRSAPAGSEKLADWIDSFKENFFSTTQVVETLRPFLRPKTGAIICISSICGIEQTGAPLTYSAAKSALNSYVVGLSKIIGKDGLRINAIAPGNILFSGSVWEKKLKESPDAVRSLLSKEVSLGILGEPEDIANACLFLSSDKAKFITGTVLVVDGGQVRSW